MMTKEEIKNREKDFKHNQFTSGGSRMFINSETDSFQLIIDTYLDDNFADYMEECVRKYFKFKTK